MLDPLDKFRKILLYSQKFTENELASVEEEVKQVITEAHKKAMAAPDPTADSIERFVIPDPYVSTLYPDGISEGKGEKKRLIEALNETLKGEFRHNPDTFIWGEDMASGEKGGVFNVTKGMLKEFGPGRVFNAPIAEDYIVGTADGMSRFSDKIRIVIEGAEFADYFWPAIEQLVEISHEYWRTNGKFSPNITIRLASGGYIGGGLYHSQTIEGALTTFPGLRIVYPSFADDAAGLLRTSIRSRGCTVFLEPKALYNNPVAETFIPEDFEVPFGKARIRRGGNNLTIITYGNTTHMCLRVAERIAREENRSIEVIDIRSLVPLDKESILNSVKKTSRAVVVHEDKVFSGFGGEIAAMIGQELFKYLDAPVKRVGSAFTPVGFNRILETAILPNDEKIYQAVKEILNY
jgi:2-oxoisovalerate dehydrogenase E1 component